MIHPITMLKLIGWRYTWTIQFMERWTWSLADQEFEDVSSIRSWILNLTIQVWKLTTIRRALKYNLATACCCHSEILRQLMWYLMWWLKILPVDAANQIPHVRPKNMVPNDDVVISFLQGLVIGSLICDRNFYWSTTCVHSLLHSHLVITPY